MRDFLLDKDGDILINADKMSLIDGANQLQQKIRQVLGTNLEEWPFDEDEGLNFRLFLSRDLDEEMARETIQNALLHVDENLEIVDFSLSKIDRKLVIQFTAKVQNGETVEIEQRY